MPAYWAVLRSAPGHDVLAYEGVCRAGFEIFTPKIRTRVRARWKTTPLFGCYFFVRVIDQWRALERTIGVLSVVKAHQIDHLSPELRRISGSVTGHQTPQKSTSKVSTKPGQLQQKISGVSECLAADGLATGAAWVEAGEVPPVPLVDISGAGRLSVLYGQSHQKAPLFRCHIDRDEIAKFRDAYFTLIDLRRKFGQQRNAEIAARKT
jgi:hypothetical protein